ncbi:MAG: hypothetical protein H0W88_11940 [Parachlamydiaceae bacterium]|nr:hypothetical protein [Parachlamydiaceae bacterium]
MFSKVVASLNNAIEYSPKKVWNSLSPINKSIIKIATAIFALSLVSYFIIRKINAHLIQSSERPKETNDNKGQSNRQTPEQIKQQPLQQPTPDPVSQEPKKEQSSQSNKESSKNQNNDDDVSENSKKEKEKKPAETILTKATMSEATTPSSVDQTSTKASEASAFVLKPQISEAKKQKTEGHQEPESEPSKATQAKDKPKRPPTQEEILNDPKLWKEEQDRKIYSEEIRKLLGLRAEICFTHLGPDSISTFMNQPSHYQKELQYIKLCTEHSKKQNLISHALIEYVPSEYTLYQKTVVIEEMFGESLWYENSIILAISRYDHWTPAFIKKCLDDIEYIKEVAKIKFSDDKDFLKSIRIKVENAIANPLTTYQELGQWEISLIKECEEKFRRVYQEKYLRLSELDIAEKFNGQNNKDIQEIFRIAELEKQIVAKSAITDATMIADIAKIDYKTENQLILALKEKADKKPIEGQPTQNTLLPTGISKDAPKLEVSIPAGTHILVADPSTKCVTIGDVPADNTKSTLPVQKTTEQTKFVEALKELRLARSGFCPDLTKIYDELVKDSSSQSRKTYLFKCRAFIFQNKNFIHEFIIQRQIFGDTQAQSKKAADDLFGADTINEFETMVFLVNNLYWSSQNQNNFITAIKKLKEAAHNLELFFSPGHLADDKVLDKVLADMTDRPVVTEKDKAFVKLCQEFCTTYENKFKNASEQIQLKLNSQANISGGIQVVFDLKYIAVS